MSSDTRDNFNEAIRGRIKDGLDANKDLMKWTEAEALELIEQIMAWFIGGGKNVFYDEYLFEVRFLQPGIMDNLASRFAKFKKLKKLVDKIQEQRLCKIGCFGGSWVNQATVQFLLTNVYGYKNKQLKNGSVGEDGITVHVMDGKKTTKTKGKK